MSQKMTWVKHIACKGEMRNAYKILVRNSEGKRRREVDLVIDGRILLKWFLKK
jgi:hypothetical protein